MRNFELKLLLVTLLTASTTIDCLENGLARRPPMGWMSWTRFECITDCKTFPKECIHENLYKEMADKMVEDGYKDAGYEYVSVDDCWSEMERDPETHRLVAHAERFPSGIKSLVDYIHALGLKFGLYSDMGNKTCAGYPGHLMNNGSDYFDIDAKTFAEWGIDYLKVDGCNIDPKEFDARFPKLSKAIEQTEWPIVFSCEWPFYQACYTEQKPDYPSIAKYCNQYRNYFDVADSWSSVLSILDYYNKNHANFSPYHGPGNWMDPDMLTIGNFGLSLDQSRSQMALWAMLSAPLVMSTDLRTIREEEKKILLNKKIIEVNQDAAGQMAKVVKQEYEKRDGVDEITIQVWLKKLSNGKFAIVYFNRRTLGPGNMVSYRLSDILNGFEGEGQPRGGPYTIRDLFEDENDDELTKKVNQNGNLTLRVNPSGVRMIDVKLN